MAAENDIVLIYLEEKPLVFARIEGILPDHKPNWYHVKMLLLQVPLQVVTWILRDVYIEGAEFTMNGKRMRLEKITPPQAPESGTSPPKKDDKVPSSPKRKEQKVISFPNPKKK
jgi:hypothetical protein